MTLKNMRPSKIKLLRIAVVPVIAILMAGCGGGGSHDDSESNDDISRSRRVWESRDISDYAYTLSRTAFAPREYNGPVRIEVRNGAVVSVTAVEPDLEIVPEAFDAVNTVDKLFDFLEAARDRNPDSQQQTFNSTYGFPESAYIDYDRQAADEENGFTVTNFVPTAPVE